MRPRHWSNAPRYRLARLAAWALIGVMTVHLALADWWARRRGRAWAEPALFHGAYVNRRERLDLWVGGGRPRAVVDTYLLAIGADRPTTARGSW
jgi:hypothetical protein